MIWIEYNKKFSSKLILLLYIFATAPICHFLIHMSNVLFFMFLKKLLIFTKNYLSDLFYKNIQKLLYKLTGWYVLYRYLLAHLYTPPPPLPWLPLANRVFVFLFSLIFIFYFLRMCWKNEMSLWTEIQILHKILREYIFVPALYTY